MKKAFVILSFLFAIPCISKAQTIALDGIYTEYKQTLLNGEDGSDYTLDGKPFKPKMQIVFDSKSDSAVLYLGSDRSKRKIDFLNDTMILTLSSKNGTNNDVKIIHQAKFFVFKNTPTELILGEIKGVFSEEFYLKKYYLKKSTELDSKFLVQNDTPYFMRCQEKASFKGGEDAMKQFIEQEVKASKLKDKIPIYITLMLTNEGKIENVQFANKLKTQYAKASMNIIKKMPNFNPAKHNGKAVASFYMLQILYK